MFAVSALCFAALCSLLCTTDAAVTAWTNPVISGTSGTGTSTTKIPENQAAGATPVTIAATAGGGKTYAITTQTTTGKLTIDMTSGVLSLASGSFDYETAKTYVLTVTCVDAGDTTTGTATVTVSITDINDVAPVFAIAQYAVTIADGATAGTALTTVTATDADTVGTITYLITAGNTNTDFAIGTSGAITVATGRTISKSTINGYSLTVQASDSATTPATTKVLVVVQTCSSGTSAIIAGGIVMLVVTTAFLF